MRFIDLTHLLNENISVYPGTEQPVFEKVNTIEKDGYAEQKMVMNTHTGTHMDAPAHMLSEGKSLDLFNPEKFYGKAICIDCTGLSGKIDVGELQKFEKTIREVDFVLLRTDWSEKWGTEAYFYNFPTLSNEACEWLTNFNLKGIGLDVVSIDPVDDSTEMINHRIAFGNGIIVIENLTDLSHLGNEVFTFSCFPLKLENADGSPIRAIAILDA